MCLCFLSVYNTDDDPLTDVVKNQDAGLVCVLLVAGLKESLAMIQCWVESNSWCLICLQLV